MNMKKRFRLLSQLLVWSMVASLVLLPQITATAAPGDAGDSDTYLFKDKITLNDFKGETGTAQAVELPVTTTPPAGTPLVFEFDFKSIPTANTAGQRMLVSLLDAQNTTIFSWIVRGDRTLNKSGDNLPSSFSGVNMVFHGSAKYESSIRLDIDLSELCSDNILLTQTQRYPDGGPTAAVSTTTNNI